MLHRCPGEMDVVGPQTTYLVVMAHGVGWEGYPDLFASEEERVSLLGLGSHHGHAPDIDGQWWNSEQTALGNVVNCFICLAGDKQGLLSGGEVVVHGAAQSSLPVRAKPHVPCGSLPFLHTPGQLLLGGVDELAWGVGDHFVLEIYRQPLSADGVANNRLILPRFGPNECLTQEAVVIVQCSDQGGVGGTVPPAKVWVIPIVEFEPVIQHIFQISDTIGGPLGHASLCSAGLCRFRSGFCELPVHLSQG